MPVEVTAEWRQFVAGLSLDAATAAGLLDPDLVDAAIARVGADDAVLASWVHANTHMTVTPTMLHAGLKANIVPDEAVAELDIRKLPGQDEHDVDDHLRKVLGPDLFDDIDLEPIHPFPAGGSRAEGPLWEAIADAAETVTGSRSLVPAITPVATDARFFRARGVVAYGAGLFDEATGFGEFLTLFHGDDERVSEESVRLTTDLLETTVARFGVRSR
jgi:acetylornithine deacetylase/succinyl-diaminopimelate desuccinylase-like protein